MRYQCRPAGKPAAYDGKFPGTYNARKDNLEGFWKGLFGYTHGLVIVNAFYENVNRHRSERRGLGEGEAIENVMLEFKPELPRAMPVACLWSHWDGRGEPDLLSFAAINDEPPPEVAAAGHNRCIITINPNTSTRGSTRIQITSRHSTRSSISATDRIRAPAGGLRCWPVCRSNQLCARAGSASAIGKTSAFSRTRRCGLNKLGEGSIGINSGSADMGLFRLIS